MPDDLRVAVIGYGLAGSAFHAPLVDAVEGMRVTAVVTGDAGRAAAARERHPGVVVHGAADAVFADPGAHDLVVVASPNRFHVEQATAALAAGLPVVVDKPAAATAAQVRALAAAAEDAGRMLTVFQNRRWDGDFLTVRRLLADGALGAVARFESRFERGAKPVRARWRTSQDPADFASIVHDLGTHVVDQAIVAFGPPTEVSAEALVTRPGVGAVEDATIALTHGGGVRSYLRVSATTVPVAPRFAVAGPTAGFRCWGLDPQEANSRAGMRPTEPGFGSYGRDGTLLTADGETPVPTQDGDYASFYRAVRDCVRGEGEPPVPLADSIVLAEVIDAALRSAEQGGPVRL
ncbi:Gfo/Idh/MocA family oxidoreductase [Actinokineospora pegani]|uniref:Gfo/Idh/MocA family oxidoreductase n=1 Tax=Actinokineospora pegani TaxID=2654637 RepID=UPI0012EA9B70|nr:Gfo/Idh/MocA family oxidoreductase [Actinokineospora pegani]